MRTGTARVYVYGVGVPASCLHWLDNLRARGLRVAVDDEGWIHVAPRQLATAEDVAALVRWRSYVPALVQYQAHGRER